MTFKKLLLIIIAAFITRSTAAQLVSTIKYKDLVFPSVTKTEDLSYTTADSLKKDKSHLFDLYQPTGDASKGRPLIIWMHGGGFKFGSKKAKGIKLWCETFAKRGYVCAAINYSLSKHNPLFHFDELLRSSYYAVQDAHTAVAYFKLHYKEYNINPDLIFLGGNSAGGMIALQAAYSSNAQLSKFAGLADTAAGAKITRIPKIAGVINYWGAIYDLDWLKNCRVPIVSAHGSKDGLVPITHKDAPLYGSLSIHQKADELKIVNGLDIFEGYSHELQKHFNPIFGVSGKTKQRWLEAGQFTADFLYSKILKNTASLKL